MANRKQGRHDTEIIETMRRLDQKMDETRECVLKLFAEFNAHLKQDERFYDEVKGVAGGQLAIAERLADYNAQLAIHIAGVNELKEQTRIIREDSNIVRSTQEVRLQRLENEVKAQEIVEENEKKAKEAFGMKLKIVGGILSMVLSVLASLKYFSHLM